MNSVIGIGEWRASAVAGDQIVTHALGSCLGITAYDFTAKVGGMVHVMLPQPGVGNAQDAELRPGKYVGPGLDALLVDCLKLGARKRHLVLTASGGASAKEATEDDFFQIGKRNITQLKKVLWMSGMMLQAQDMGGTQPRTLSLDIATGNVEIKSNGTTRRLL